MVLTAINIITKPAYFHVSLISALFQIFWGDIFFSIFVNLSTGMGGIFPGFLNIHKGSSPTPSIFAFDEFSAVSTLEYLRFGVLSSWTWDLVGPWLLSLSPPFVSSVGFGSSFCQAYLIGETVPWFVICIYVDVTPTLTVVWLLNTELSSRVLQVHFFCRPWRSAGVSRCITISPTNERNSIEVQTSALFLLEALLEPLHLLDVNFPFQQ